MKLAKRVVRMLQTYLDGLRQRRAHRRAYERILQEGSGYKFCSPGRNSD